MKTDSKNIGFYAKNAHFIETFIHTPDSLSMVSQRHRHLLLGTVHGLCTRNTWAFYTEYMSFALGVQKPNTATNHKYMPAMMVFYA